MHSRWRGRPDGGRRVAAVRDGLHLHFLAEDRASGGHVLDVVVRSGELRLAAYAGFELRLPTDERFLRTELTHDDDHRIQAAEGGAAAR